jgi:hypothetical protein
VPVFFPSLQKPARIISDSGIVDQYVYAAAFSSERRKGLLDTGAVVHVQQDGRGRASLRADAVHLAGEFLSTACRQKHFDALPRKDLRKVHTQAAGSTRDQGGFAA